MKQTTNLGLGRTDEHRIEGYALGRSRTGSFNALSAVAWGSNLQHGRVVIYSPEYNAANAAGVENPIRSVALPDAAGEYIRDPATGLPLSTNAALLAQLNSAPSQLMVAGVVTDGDRCDDTRCDRPEVWPVGDHDNMHEWAFAQNRRPVTVQTRGYARVRIGTDIPLGATLAYSTTVDDTDPDVGVRTIGSIVDASLEIAGSFVLPESWYVVTAGKAGKTAEIYIGSGNINTSEVVT